MISDSAWKYCEDGRLYEIEGFEVAASSPALFVLHHKIGSLCNRTRDELVERNLYYNRPPNELQFMKREEHMSHHRMVRKNPMLREQLRRFELKRCYDNGLYIDPWMLSDDECQELNQEVSEFKKMFNI